MAVRHRIDHDHDDAEPPGELGHLPSVGRVDTTAALSRPVLLDGIEQHWPVSRIAAEYRVGVKQCWLNCIAMGCSSLTVNARVDNACQSRGAVGQAATR